MSFYDIIQALLGWLKNSSAFSAKMAQLYNSVYSRISFSDFTGDDNSDLQVYLSHSDMSESYIVWAWEESEG